MPVTVVCRLSATEAIETFMTELSRAIRNCDEPSTARISPPPAAAVAAAPVRSPAASVLCASFEVIAHRPFPQERRLSTPRGPV
jgi:hypothetical protein